MCKLPNSRSRNETEFLRQRAIFREKVDNPVSECYNESNKLYRSRSVVMNKTFALVLRTVSASAALCMSVIYGWMIFYSATYISARVAEDENGGSGMRGGNAGTFQKKALRRGAYRTYRRIHRDNAVCQHRHRGNIHPEICCSRNGEKHCRFIRTVLVPVAEILPAGNVSAFYDPHIFFGQERSGM